MKGELIGINGRGSFDKRGRVNSGVGYAISINQIKNFMGHLRAGLDADHASLGAVVRTETEKSGLGRMIVAQILEDSDVFRRGVEDDDEILSFAGRVITSVNHFQNVMGLYPRGWRLPLEFRREQVRKEVLVRLMGVMPKTLVEGEAKPSPPPPKQKVPAPKSPPSPAAKFYKPKPGFANFYFNNIEKERLVAAFKKHGDFSAVAGAWNIDGNVRLKKSRTSSPVSIEIAEVKQGASFKPVVKMTVGAYPYALEPQKEQDPAVLKMPPESGGLLSALYVYQQLLTQGEREFGDFAHGGHEPFYPPPADAKTPRSPADLRVDTEVLNTRLGPFLTKWFFAGTDQKLLGYEVRLQENEDPCEVYLSDYRAVEGRLLPHRLQVIYGNGHYGTFDITSFKLAAAK
jgi:hypothetical protein